MILAKTPLIVTKQVLSFNVLLLIMSSRIFPGILKRDMGLKLLISVGAPFLNTGLTCESFQFVGKTVSSILFLKTGSRLWIDDSPRSLRSLGETRSGPVALLGFDDFSIFFFTSFQFNSMSHLVGVTLVT